VAGIIIIINVSDDVISRKPRAEIINDSNLIEYVNIIEKSDGYPVLKDIYTRATLNMRNKPGIKSDIITKIPKNTSVEIRSARPYEGWFRVDYNGKSGWVYGKYLKRESTSVTYAGPISRGLDSTFPEESWWGKLFAVFIGVTISFLLAWLGFMDDVLLIFRFVVTWAYFFVKNIYIVYEVNSEVFEFGTLFFIILFAVIMSFVLNLVANLILNIIHEYKSAVFDPELG
jgi:hypothetical protein